MFESGDFELRDLGGVVPVSEAEGVSIVGVSFKLGAFEGSHRAALDFEAELRRGGQSLQVGGILGAQIAFGIDVQTDGFGDFGAEVFREPRVGGRFVLAVDAVDGEVFILSVQEMTDVVHKCGDHQVIGSSLSFSERCRLERVLRLRDGFAVIGGVAALVKQVNDFVDDLHEKDSLMRIFVTLRG